MRNNLPVETLKEKIGAIASKKDIKPFHLEQLFIYQLEVRLFVKRFEFIESVKEGEFVMTFDSGFKRAISQLNTSVEIMEHETKQYFPNLLDKSDQEQLLSIMSSINLALIYGDLENWEDNLKELEGMVKEKFKSNPNNYKRFIERITERGKGKNVVEHYICFLFEYYAIRHREMCIIDSPLLKFRLKKAYKDTKAPLEKLEKSFLRAYGEWNVESFPDLVEELSYNSTGMNELMLFKNPAERKMIAQSLGLN